ncbi:hypothetical protein H0O00_00105 [Candidatus Micrarchaeota archaeon]|nr:hypothetical protein [Candidatus Micrarchaeota archaeon]
MKPLTHLASQILSAFKSRNQRRLRKLNDEVLRTAAMEFNNVTFNLAVFSYVMSKIVSKPRFIMPEFEPALRGIENAMGRLVDRMETADEAELLSIFKEMEKYIGRLEEKDPRFVVDLVTKGRLKMAATFYAQGMSLGVAAEMTGLDKQEIQDYAGETMMFDRLKDEKGIAERMKTARKLITG